MHIYLDDGRIVGLAEGAEITSGAELSPTATGGAGMGRTAVLIVTDAQGKELARFVESKVDGWTLT